MRYNLENYKLLINLLITAEYNFLTFDKVNQGQSKEVLLRHDVDNDVMAARIMAKVEQNLGITSTYFFMTRSPVYNVFSRHNHAAILDILSMGHSIGLHYDQGYDEIRGLTVDDTKSQIQIDCQLLELEFKTTIAAVSFHQPNRRVLESEEFRLAKYINTYDKHALKRYKYFSDSNRTFDWDRVQDCVSESSDVNTCRNLQLLIHPMWWVYPDKKIEDVWNAVLENSIKYALPQLRETERTFHLINNNKEMHGD